MSRVRFYLSIQCMNYEPIVSLKFITPLVNICVALIHVWMIFEMPVTPNEWNNVFMYLILHLKTTELFNNFNIVSLSLIALDTVTNTRKVNIKSWKSIWFLKSNTKMYLIKNDYSGSFPFYRHFMGYSK